MHRNLFALNDAKIEAVERLLLYRFLQRFGASGSPRQPLEALLADLQFTYKRGAEVLNALVEKHELLDRSAPPGGEGRPLSSYLPTEKLLAKLDQADVGPIHHDHRITSVLWQEIRHRSKPAKKAGKAPDTSGMGKTLSPKDLWLLGVMLAHADERGVISDLSRASLSQLTGMLARTLIRRHHRMEELGIAIRAIPWASSDCLSGALNSLIHLNLDHDLFSQPKQLAAAIHFYGYIEDAQDPDQTLEPRIRSLPLTPFCQTKRAMLREMLGELPLDGLEASATDDGYVLDLECDDDEIALKRAELDEELKRAKLAMGAAKTELGWREALEPYFRDFQKPRVLNWFRGRISLYAASMLELQLNSKPSCADEGESTFDSPAMELIRSDFSSTKLLKGDLEPLHEYVHDLAHRYADYLKSLIDEGVRSSEEWREALGQNTMVTIVPKNQGEPDFGQLLGSIFFWRATVGQPSREPFELLCIARTDEAGLPGIKWLQKPLPAPATPSIRAGQGVRQE